MPQPGYGYGVPGVMRRRAGGWEPGQPLPPPGTQRRISARQGGWIPGQPFPPASPATGMGAQTPWGAGQPLPPPTPALACPTWASFRGMSSGAAARADARATRRSASCLPAVGGAGGIPSPMDLPPELLAMLRQRVGILGYDADRK